MNKSQKNFAEHLEQVNCESKLALHQILKQKRVQSQHDLQSKGNKNQELTESYQYILKKQNHHIQVKLMNNKSSDQIYHEIKQIRKLKEGLTPFIYKRLDSQKQWTRDGGLFKLKLSINNMNEPDYYLQKQKAGNPIFPQISEKRTFQTSKTMSSDKNRNNRAVNRSIQELKNKQILQIYKSKKSSFFQKN